MTKPKGMTKAQRIALGEFSRGVLLCGIESSKKDRDNFVKFLREQGHTAGYIRGYLAIQGARTRLIRAERKRLGVA